MPKVLVVDDEGNIRDLVGVYLAAAGFEVITASDGREAVALFASHEPDLVVLDIMLPGLDGPAVLARIREAGNVPVIMLTAKTSDLDKVSLLEHGADDYLTKPFSPPELVARARAVLRRGGTVGCVTRELIEIGGLVIDPAAREVTVDGSPVELTAREFDLLAAMAASPGIVFSRETLLERTVGTDEYVDARGIDVHVRHVRDKLGDSAAAPRFVETVRGVGYRVRRDAS